jgi:ribonuclease P protein component
MKIQALRKRAQFLALKAVPNRAHGAGFVLQWAEVEGEGLQVGYTASTAAIGNAVRRNRARRRLRAAFDKLVRCNPKASASKALHMNWVAKAPVLDVAFEVLVADMVKALAKAGVAV